jgi:hypothetical protein
MSVGLSSFSIEKIVCRSVISYRYETSLLSIHACAWINVLKCLLEYSYVMPSVAVTEVGLDWTNGFQIVAVRALNEHGLLDPYSRLMLYSNFLTISVGFEVHGWMLSWCLSDPLRDKNNGERSNSSTRGCAAGSDNEIKMLCTSLSETNIISFPSFSFQVNQTNVYTEACSWSSQPAPRRGILCGVLRYLAVLCHLPDEK